MDQEMTISSPPTATLAGVLVRHNASVEGRNRIIPQSKPKKWRNMLFDGFEDAEMVIEM
jgi:hypothetical protein